MAEIKNLTNGTVDFGQINKQIEKDLLDTMGEYAIYFTSKW